MINTANFVDFQALAYWSGTEYALNTNLAWYFMTTNIAGYQFDISKTGSALYAVAVRAGDVGGSVSVPLPSTAALHLVATGALGLSRRRRPA